MEDVMNVLGKYDVPPENLEGVSEGGSGASGYVVAFGEAAELEKISGPLSYRDKNFTECL